jgi:hypothetical protein
MLSTSQRRKGAEFDAAIERSGLIGDDNQFDRRGVEHGWGWTFPSD